MHPTTRCGEFVQGAVDKVSLSHTILHSKSAVVNTSRGLDLVMKCFTNAKERDLEEWAELFAMADPRFKFLGVRTPLGSKASFIEAEWRPLEDEVREEKFQVKSAEDVVVKTASVDGVKLDVIKGDLIA
jgi:hypothetical protein